MNVGQEAGRRTRHAVGQSAKQRRRGHADHGDAGQIQRRGCDRDRFRGGIGAASGDRG